MSQPRPEHDTPTTTGKPPGLVVKIADAREREIALQRRAEIYTQELGYHGLDEYDKDAIHLVAMDERGEMVGAVRLLGPQPLPLEVFSFLTPTEVDLQLGCAPLQIGGLWISHLQRRIAHKSLVSLALLKYAIAIAERFAASAFVLRTVPRLRAYYETVHFRPLGKGIFDDPHWGRVAIMFRPLNALPVGARSTRAAA
jgi:predicted GNAT family N-acyltransferase